MERTLGQKIRDERKKNKLTQRELAGNFITRNMLSQIENNQAKPSITTMAYLANRLNKTIDYFMSEETKSEQIAKLAKELMADYKEDNCLEVLERLEALRIESPSIFNSNFIEDIYINCHFKKFESNLLLNHELIAYELYVKLVDAYTMTGDHKKAAIFNKKAKELIRRLIASKEVQDVYLLFSQNDNEEAIKAAKNIDFDMLDDYSKARYNMVIGSAYFNLKDYHKAIKYLEMSITYYQEKMYNSLTVMIFEELSKCYANLDHHEKAVEYMKMAKLSYEKGHIH
jgi:transcriptional regulator with XRE-family HTH domain